MFQFLDSQFSLIYWPDEDSVSTVKRSDVLDQDVQTGDMVKVKFGRHIYKGVLKATADIATVRKLVEEFLQSREQHQDDSDSDEQHSQPLKDCTNDDNGRRGTKRTKDANLKVCTKPGNEENAKAKRPRNSKSLGKIITVVPHTDDTRTVAEAIPNSPYKQEFEDVKDELSSLKKMYLEIYEQHQDLLRRVETLEAGSKIAQYAVCQPSMEDLSFNHDILMSLESPNSPTAQPSSLTPNSPVSQPTSVTSHSPTAQPTSLAPSTQFSQPTSITPNLQFSQPTSVTPNLQFSQPTSLAPNSQFSQPTSVTPDPQFIQPTSYTPYTSITEPTSATLNTLITPHTHMTQPTPVTPYTPIVQPTSATPYTPFAHPTSMTPQAFCTQPASVSLSTPDNQATQHSASFLSIDTVIRKYPMFHSKSKLSRLAVKIAREAVFGQQVMRESTPLGSNNLKALDFEKLLAIKGAVQLFCNQGDLESTWKVCMEAIGQACKFERKKMSLNTN